MPGGKVADHPRWPTGRTGRYGSLSTCLHIYLSFSLCIYPCLRVSNCAFLVSQYACAFCGGARFCLDVVCVCLLVSFLRMFLWCPPSSWCFKCVSILAIVASFEESEIDGAELLVRMLPSPRILPSIPHVTLVQPPHQHYCE